MTEQTVFVVDDDEAVRDSIKELVESVGLPAETYKSATSFLDSYSEDRPGCLVLDVRMAKMSGIVLQRKLKERGCRLPIVFVSGHGDIDTAVSAVKMGAVDFIQKPYHEHGLLDSINEALRLDAENASEDQKSPSMESHIASLTAREREVMQLLLQGFSNKHVARALNISPRTVEVLRRHVLEKCGVKSVTELLAQLGEIPQ